MDKDRTWLIETCQSLIGGDWSGDKHEPEKRDGVRRSIRFVAENELGISGQGLRQWLNGERSTDNLALGNWRALAKALGKTTAELDEDYDRYMQGSGDKGPDKSKLRKVRQAVYKILREIDQIDQLEMTESFPPTPDNDNTIQVGRLSTYLQVFLSQHELNWLSPLDVKLFAEASGKIGSPDCPWEAEDIKEPDGILYQAIAGTLPRVTESLVTGLSISCTNLGFKAISPNDLVRICNGEDMRAFLNNGCAAKG